MAVLWPSTTVLCDSMISLALRPLAISNPNFLLRSGNKINSDLQGMIILYKNDSKNYYNETKYFFNKTKENIMLKKYDGIIDGINDELLLTFPEIMNHYVLDEKEEIKSGFFNYEIKLYIPK